MVVLRVLHAWDKGGVTRVLEPPVLPTLEMGWHIAEPTRQASPATPPREGN